jgi:hypothetical protein
MNGCLQGVQPQDRLHTIWASSWGSQTFLPLMWANDAWTQQWMFVGGVNRCGAYCSAWGCGQGQAQHWDQNGCFRAD